MQRTYFPFWAAGVIALISGCATTHDLPEKYAAYVGQQFRTRHDGYIWKMPRNEHEFHPYVLASSSALGTRLDRIPAGTIVTIKGAKRSYKGGDWDYLIAEVRAPESGKIYTFEDMLGFSTYLPKDIEKFLEPLEKGATVNQTFNSEEFFNAPNGRFSIRKAAFPRPPQSRSTTESEGIGALSFFLPKREIVRIDFWSTPQQPLARWARQSSEINTHDRTLDGVTGLTRAKTKGLKELTLLGRRPSSASGGMMSSAVFRMRIQGGEHAGSYYRGFLAFSHNNDSYILHYQSNETFPDEKAASETVLNQLNTLKEAMVFHSR